MAAPKVLIAFYSRTGTIERLARAVAEGAQGEGAEVRLRRARELVGHDIMSAVPGWKESAEAMNAQYPAPTAEDAVWADAVIFGTPTRFGNVCSELKAYIDGLGGLWAKGALVGCDAAHQLAGLLLADRHRARLGVHADIAVGGLLQPEAAGILGMGGNRGQGSESGGDDDILQAHLFLLGTARKPEHIFAPEMGTVAEPPSPRRPF